MGRNTNYHTNYQTTERDVRIDLEMESGSERSLKMVRLK